MNQQSEAISSFDVQSSALDVRRLKKASLFSHTLSFTQAKPIISEHAQRTWF